VNGDEEIPVCACADVTQAEVLAAMAAGHRTVPALQRATGACVQCGCCRPELEALIAAVAEGRISLPGRP
jgi:NAD(P)H-nitrite reductase large subunit